MTTHTKRPYAQPFIALELALSLIESLRPIVARVRTRSARQARQLEDAASSIAANLAEGNRRQGRDRSHFFTIAAGSADETRCHLRIAQAWGWLTPTDTTPPLHLRGRQLARLWKLSH
ncbi:MAG: four helix bundle protein [Myxococcales bacterium]|nr:four helix bundle protein [Myxococcales bacterium]